MSRARVISRTSGPDQALVDMFNQMVNGEGDPEIVAGKQTETTSAVRMIARVCEEFSTGGFSQMDAYRERCAEFARMAAATRLLEPMSYAERKTHPQTRAIVALCADLVPYAHNLQSGHLNDRWITTQPGASFIPITFSRIDAKQMWCDPAVGPTARQYFLQTLSLLFGFCHRMYVAISSPDMDVKRLARTLIENLSRVRNVPELSRCREAFRKIEESVSMLEGNFDGYYKDMVQSRNPSMMIESFIVDVSKSPGMDLRLVAQFRTIINYYQKRIATQVVDPRTREMFNALNSRMSSLEREAGVRSDSAAASGDHTVAEPSASTVSAEPSVAASDASAEPSASDASDAASAAASSE